jgi:hypothetical protein
MKHFIKRYFGWYLWLSIYTTAIGGLIGLACFSLSPFFPIFVMFFFVLYPAALALALRSICWCCLPLSICSGIIRGAKRGFT